MDQIKNAFAVKLMEIKAIKLQPNEPFTWASGWKSPIYTDNRKTLSFPALRSFVKLELCHAIQEHFPEAEAVAGVATDCPRCPCSRSVRSSFLVCPPEAERSRHGQPDRR